MSIRPGKNGFHVNNDGAVGGCDAPVGSCRFGGSDGTIGHFSSEKEARDYAEKRNGLGWAEVSTQRKIRRADNVGWTDKLPETDGNDDNLLEASQNDPQSPQEKARALWEYAQQSELVNVRESVRYPGLYVLKYHKKVFYKNLWNEQLTDCRGIVFDKDGNIVSLPFTKIYNDRVEENAPKIDDDEPVTYMRKVNGFMGALTVHNGEPVWSTTGSLDSDFAKMFEDMTPDSMVEAAKASPGKTFLFEVVHPSDPHIVPEEAGIYLLGARKKEMDSPVEIFDESDVPKGVRSVPKMSATMGEVRAKSKEVNHEGFVVYASEGRSTKIKSPYYLTNKFLARGGAKNILSPGARERVDEEYYPLLDAVQEQGESFLQLSEEERLDWCRNFLKEHSNG